MKKYSIQANLEVDIFNVVNNEACLFHDQFKEPYISINNEPTPINKKSFKKRLTHMIWKRYGTSIPKSKISTLIEVLEGTALYDSQMTRLYNRVGQIDNSFYYDLGNGSVIKTDPMGWSQEKAPILFRKYSHQLPQVEPITSGDIWKIFDFLNVQEEHRLLFLAYLISCFIPDIAHPILHPHGPQGAAKSTLCKIIKKLCDPSSISVLEAPKAYNKCVQTLSHHHICFFDNVSNISPRISDLLAQACTGTGFSKRKLYTNDDDVIYSIQNCVGLNGINLAIDKADLMDRSIIIKMDRIPEEKRMAESTLWDEFEQSKPHILGGIFDTLCKAMKIYPQIEVQNISRMVDFTQWGYAISMALTGSGDKFLKAYKDNMNQQTQEIVQTNSLVQAVLTFMEKRNSWSGTVKEAYDNLSMIAGSQKSDDSFPRHTNKLRRHLNRVKVTLFERGVEYIIGEFHNVNGVPIKFKKV